MDNAYVYTLTDPRNGLPFYVGKGHGKRCYAHLDEAKYYLKRKSKKINKIRKLISLGMTPIIKKIEENVSDKQALEFEVFVIAEMRESGIVLTNMTDGGDGAKGYRHPQEHLDRMSVLFKNRIVSEETKQRMRKPKSPEGRAAIAMARLTTTYRPSEETKHKTSLALLGRPSPMKGRTQSEEAKAKMSEQRIGKPKPKVECPHCRKMVAINTAKRWHFDNCKDKE